MTTPSVSASTPVTSDATPGKHWLDWLYRALQAIESRRHLIGMDDRMLADIGISRADALREAARSPWDLTPPRR